MKRFTFYFPSIANAHFTKDICIIPYVMQKYYGYKSSLLITMPYAYFPDNEKYLENLKIDFIEDEEQIDLELAKIDVLMLVGMHKFNLNMINRYKKINPNGTIYLKLDINEYWLNSIENDMEDSTKDALKKCDVISTESRRIQYFLNITWGLGVKFIPNGYYDFYNNKVVDYSVKENIILYAGRIGPYQKNNEMLLEAFINIKDQIKDWKLVFVGSMEDKFRNYLYEILNKNKDLYKQIIFMSEVNKDMLKGIYEQSKIFCLTSRYEACANVLSESVANGCYLITTDVDGAVDIIDYGKYGRLIPVGNVKKLEEALLEVCSDESMIKENFEKSQKYIKSTFNWINLCGEINSWLS